jgi:hypothetical protein
MICQAAGLWQHDEIAAIVGDLFRKLELAKSITKGPPVCMSGFWRLLLSGTRGGLAGGAVLRQTLDQTESYDD